MKKSRKKGYDPFKIGKKLLPGQVYIYNITLLSLLFFIFTINLFVFQRLHCLPLHPLNLLLCSPLDQLSTVKVQVSFKSTCETIIDDQPILRCKVIDGDGGEAIASIPIKLSVKSVYSKLIF